MEIESKQPRRKAVVFQRGRQILERRKEIDPIRKLSLLTGRGRSSWIYLRKPTRLRPPIGGLRNGGSAFGGNATGATLGPINETNMARIWNKHKQTSTPLKRKVFVALSGGVDSSVAAALLLRQGYEVTGAFMKQWSDGQQTSDYGLQATCSWKQDRRDALRVAAHLGIPLITLDFEKEYKQRVIKYMFREYRAGRTPNPDVLCNQQIKFGVWLDKARELGFEYLATGHYANIRTTKNTRPTSLRRSRCGRAKVRNGLRSESCGLQVAKDKNKDQTYFLHQLTQAQLTDTLFPIGGYLKSEVRMLARQFKLPTAERAESMGICFVGEVPMKEFLMRKIKLRPGKIALTDGTVIGEHDGLAFYTIGQRHLGMQNSEFRMQNGASKPLYVVGKHLKTNELIVGHEDDPALYRKEILVNDVNWVAGRPPAFPLQCKVRLRHRQTLQAAEIRNWKLETRGVNNVVVTFRKPQRAVTPGQFAVFYKNDECLGGGVIQVP